MPQTTRRPHNPTVFLKVRPPDLIDVFDLRSKKRLRTLKVPARIFSAGLSTAHRNGKSAEMVWVNVPGNRCLTFVAKTGRLRGISPDPAKQAAIQRSLRAFEAKRKSAIRYAVIRPLSRACTLFYDFADGTWGHNRISATAMFKEKKVAEAAAKALTEARRSHFFRDSVPMQVLALKKTAKVMQILSSVRGPLGIYRPILRRAQRAGSPFGA